MTTAVGKFRLVTLDDSTRQIYRRTDSASLLALLPELRRLSKRTQKEMGIGDDGSNGASLDEGFAEQLVAYSVALEERERWIRDELKRRGLIPLWPGERTYLIEDA